VRLIIVCDEPSAARRLCTELSNRPAKTVCVTDLEGLKDACELLFELALINVALATLVECVLITGGQAVERRNRGPL
jgi:hypothetical protein